MGDTATSVNQGGASGSTGIQFGGKQMRWPRRKRAACCSTWRPQKLGTPADQLIVVNDGVSAAFNRDKKTSYAELIGGKYFNVQLEWNKQMGNALYAPGFRLRLARGVERVADLLVPVELDIEVAARRSARRRTSFVASPLALTTPSMTIACRPV